MYLKKKERKETCCCANAFKVYYFSAYILCAYKAIQFQNAGSLGALAGFAIAIAFTWKFLRAPSRPRRGQRKRIGSASTSSHGTQADEDGDSELQPPLLLNDNDAINESHPPLKVHYHLIF